MSTNQASLSDITLTNLLGQASASARPGPSRRGRPSATATRNASSGNSARTRARQSNTSPALPTASWNSSNHVLVDKLVAANSAGVMLINDIGIDPPMIAIRETFCRLYQDSDFVQSHLNKLNQIRGLFKNLGYVDPKQIDQKAILDLSPSEIVLLDGERFDLGSSFRTDVLRFYYRVVEQIIPRLIYIASVAMTGGIGVGENYSNPAADHICSIHGHNNVKFRLVDFYPVHQTRKRCLEHRDFPTFTLIFQDKREGGLEVFVDNRWVEVPAEAEVVFMYGWSAHIMSNARVNCPLHRVMPLKTDEKSKALRRNEAVFYVAPDWDAFLHPLLIFPKETLQFKASSVMELTVRKFKDLFGLKWHKREGSLTVEEKTLMAAIALDEQEATTQDEDIVKFLQTGQSVLSHEVSTDSNNRAAATAASV